jgi:hypothetical protein
MNTVAPLTSERTVSFCNFTFSGTCQTSVKRELPYNDTRNDNARLISRFVSLARGAVQSFRCPLRRPPVALARTRDYWHFLFVA